MADFAPHESTMDRPGDVVGGVRVVVLAILSPHAGATRHSLWRDSHPHEYSVPRMYARAR